MKRSYRHCPWEIRAKRTYGGRKWVSVCPHCMSDVPQKDLWVIKHEWCGGQYRYAHLLGAAYSLLSLIRQYQQTSIGVAQAAMQVDFFDLFQAWHRDSDTEVDLKVFFS